MPPPWSASLKNGMEDDDDDEKKSYKLQKRRPSVTRRNEIEDSQSLNPPLIQLDSGKAKCLTTYQARVLTLKFPRNFLFGILGNIRTKKISAHLHI